jgi:hypothetical protein
VKPGVPFPQVQPLDTRFIDPHEDSIESGQILGGDQADLLEELALSPQTSEQLDS